MMHGDVLADSFPEGFTLPAEFRALCEWVNQHGYPISGDFEIRAHEDDAIRCWFQSEKPLGQLAQFGAGPDGSLYCFWMREDGRTPIVHMGSEGDHNCVLATTPVEFLRLLAIGYDEIGFADLTEPPSDDDASESVNPEFRQWVVDRFKVSIPLRGVDITDAAQSREDDFAKWVAGQYGK